MELATVLIDSREQKPYGFEGYPVTTRRETLTTGDYTLPQFCEHDDDADTYTPFLAVERKTGNDFISSITRDRERFKNEILRAEDWREQLKVVVETPKDKFEQNVGPMQYRNVAPAQVMGTVEAWERYYNVEFKFFANRSMAEQRTHDLLVSWLRAYGEV